MSSEPTVSSEASVILDDWEEVYNSTDERHGQSREYYNQPGTFYQTYGNGGGKNGWGGYWVREGGTAVWEVAGDEFKYLENHILEYQPWREGRGGHCRVFVPEGDKFPGPVDVDHSAVG